MMEATGNARWQRSWDWLWPCVLLLLLGAGLRWSTLGEQPDYLHTASVRLAYSDVVAFYAAGDHRLPYIEHLLEYPVITGFVFWLTGFAPGGQHGYFLTNALLLSAALLATFVLIRQAGEATQPVYFALAPGLAFYSTLNWDALAVLGLVATILFTRRGQFFWAGISLAFGAPAKLFPLYVLPALLAYTLALGAGQQSRDWRATLRAFATRPPRQFLGGVALGLLAFNLPIFILTPSGWSYFMRFQAGRTSNLDSIWQHLPTTPDRVQTAIFIGGIIGLTRRVLRGASWEVAALLSLIAFLLATKVYSPQDDLWLLPFFALLAPPVWLWLAFIFADALYYWTVFYFYTTLDPERIFLVGVGVWRRELALLLLAGWALRRLAATPATIARPATLAATAEGDETQQVAVRR